MTSRINLLERIPLPELFTHVTPHPDGGWQVKGAGNTKATSRHDTQREAIDSARDIAKNQGTEVVIHRRKGCY
ncbi:DUF2188 domain-containing protein [Psychrobacillus sp. FJAT-51614]|uniref:DUF2188 domain-containing protein n=1 Tax=Psychrobacillus mangrovi TaxID=3117745 RepID=A0ABU8FAE1_9BACI